MQLAQCTTPEWLPCPLCTSQLILPVLRCATNCDVKIKLIHCNTCGLEAPQHTWNTWARPTRALNDNGGKRFAPASWLDALEQMWIGRLDYYECHHPDRGYGEIHGHTEELRQCLKEYRAIKKGASNDTR